jgi:hypothetical protein
VNAIKKIRKMIEKDPSTPTARTLSALVLALESEENFQLGEIYKLDYQHFDLALELLREWRLDRFYSGKARLIDASVQSEGLRAGK